MKQDIAVNKDFLCNSWMGTDIAVGKGRRGEVSKSFELRNSFIEMVPEETLSHAWYVLFKRWPFLPTTSLFCPTFQIRWTGGNCWANLWPYFNFTHGRIMKTQAPGHRQGKGLPSLLGYRNRTFWSFDISLWLFCIFLWLFCVTFSGKQKYCDVFLMYCKVFFRCFPPKHLGVQRFCPWSPN